MKILILYEYFAPAQKSGGISRSLLNLSLMLSKANEVYVFTSNKDLGDSDKLPVEENVWINFEENIKVFYSNSKFGNLLFINKAFSIIQPDVVYINGMFTPHFSLFPLLIRIINKRKIKYVVAPRGMVQEGALHQKSFKKTFYLGFLKIFGLLNNIVWHVTDKQEEVDVLSLNITNPRIKLASNIPFFCNQVNKSPFKDVNKLSIVYLSLITEKKNLHFALQTLAEVSLPIEVSFDIYGPIKDELYWKECNELIKAMPPNIKVSYKGAVNPINTQFVLSQYHLFYLPTKGENFGHAIFESLSASTPVLLSDKTPWRNLETIDAGWDFNLHDQSRFSSLIIEIAKLNDSSYIKYRTGAILAANNFIKNTDFEKQYFELFKSSIN